MVQELTLPQVQSHRVQTADGKWITVHEARLDAGDTPKPLMLEQGIENPGAPAGRRPMTIDKGKQKVRLWRGNVPSDVPAAHFLVFLKHGWTAEPTLPLPELDFGCGVMLSEGPCRKMLRTRLDRLRHIKAYHPDAAQFTFTDDEKRVLRGELGLAALDPQGGVSSSEVAELRSVLAEQKSLIDLLMAERMQQAQPFTSSSATLAYTPAPETTAHAAGTVTPEPVKVRRERRDSTKICAVCGEMFTGKGFGLAKALRDHMAAAHRGVA
ncbi:MAG: hypothetical protein IT318_20370 [Anaerolineales bacterium]|nr:hypothetical protein [Anaerolineales bacterium]